ncbi:nuclease [Pasteurellaceae bacterium RH1A]|nr:nuclease [Pasteurellaceae bacterium RH1A]
MKGLFILLQFFLLLTPLTWAAQRQIQCKVVGISDGDTLTCLHNRNQLKVRLQYIDAPESAQPFGNRAKQALASYAFKKEVRLLVSGYDKYQRLLAVVFDERNQNLNLKLVEDGLAWAYRQTKPLYKQAEDQARQRGLGLWRDPNPINPADWRKIYQDKRSHSGPNLQNQSSNPPLVGRVDCSVKLSCGKIERMGGDYALAKRYFDQCGWAEMDGNRDGIPCNSLYRKAQRR